jgi:hypothetical protein
MIIGAGIIGVRIPGFACGLNGNEFITYNQLISMVK